MSRAGAFVAVTAAGAAALAACTLLVPLDDAQCATDGDCAARGAAFAGAVCVNRACRPSSSGLDAGDIDASDAGPDSARDPWRCLADPPQSIDPAASIDLEIHVLDALKSIVTDGVNGGSDLTLLSGTPLPGVTVTGCDSFDYTCSNPILDAARTDEAGVVHFAVHGDFSGYFELARAGLFPSTMYSGQALSLPGVQSLISPNLSTAAVQQLAATVGVTLATDPDGGLGHAFFLIYDCDDRHAPGVSFTIADGGTPDGAATFYTQGAFPNPKATQTDPLGAGGVINYPAGFAVITATEVATGRVLGSMTTFIRPGSMAFSWIRVRTRIR